MRYFELFEDHNLRLRGIKSIPKLVHDFAEKLNVSAVLIQFNVVEWPALELTDLFADTTGQGSGTKVMAYLGQLADKYDLNIYLKPSEPRNVDFYRRFGFDWDKHNHRRFMVRYPPLNMDDDD